MRWLCVGLALSLLGCTFRTRSGEDVVMSVAVNPYSQHIVYAGTRKAVYGSGDLGETWRKLGKDIGQSIIALVVDPQMPSAIYAATFGNAVYRYDGGRWILRDGARCGTAVKPGLREYTGSLLVFSLAVDGRGEFSTLYAGTASGIYISRDGGACWHDSNQGLENLYTATVAIHPMHPDTLYIGTVFGVYKSTDQGRSWVVKDRGMGIGHPPVRPPINAIVIDPRDPAVLYAGSKLGVFKSTDGGERWALKKEGLTVLFVETLSIDPNEPATLYAGTNGGLFKTTDGAERWVPTNAGLTNLAIRELAIHPTASTLFAATEGGLFKSTDGATTWRRVELGPA